MKKKHLASFDYKFLGLFLVLLAFGLSMLYSASTVEAFKNTGNTNYYILHQLEYGVLPGLVFMYVASRIDYHFWQKILPVMIIASLVLLVLVLIPGLSLEAGGAHRWLKLGPASFQPAEFAKLAVIFYLASWIDRKNNKLNDFYFGLLPSLVIIGLFAGLILMQPDLGTMLVLLGISVAMIFVSGIGLKVFGGIMAAGMAVLFAFIKFEPYRAQRLATFLNPQLDPQGISYQVNQAILAIGAGGFWGYGYGLSRQKHNYLPEVMTDSIFAVTGEELGFLRVMLVLTLFSLLVIKGYRMALKAPDNFGKLLSFGIISWIAVQALINIGAMVGLLPLTGIPLPFFSYGGSSLMFIMGALGIVLNISRQSSHLLKTR